MIKKNFKIYLYEKLRKLIFYLKFLFLIFFLKYYNQITKYFKNRF